MMTMQWQGRKEGRKYFFFEKKKQKTFSYEVGPAMSRGGMPLHSTILATPQKRTASLTFARVEPIGVSCVKVFEKQ
jgi:hypothetical protein